MKKIFAGHKVFISKERAKHWGGQFGKALEYARRDV